MYICNHHTAFAICSHGAAKPTDIRYGSHVIAMERVIFVEFWYLEKWSPSVIDVPNTKGGKVPLPHFTLCYKVKVTL
jgi:hypothetical protein